MCIARDLGASGRFPSSSVQFYILGTHQNQNYDRLPYVVRIHHTLSLSLIPTSQEANARERCDVPVRTVGEQNSQMNTKQPSLRTVPPTEEPNR